MKKVAVTGHTRGIGKGIYDYFIEKGYDVHGFSRTNGYDLSFEDIQNKVTQETKDFDIFINNAYNWPGGFAQTQLLHKLFPLWKDKGGWIFNISSVASDFVVGRLEPNPYSILKLALDSYHKQLSWHLQKVNLVLIRPGRVDTPAIEKIEGRKLRVSDVVDTLDWILTRPEDVFICEVTIRVKDPEKYKNV